MSRTLNDVYKLANGQLIEVGQNEQAPPLAKLWHGYDYNNQYWVYEGEKDTRTLEELQASRRFI